MESLVNDEALALYAAHVAVKGRHWIRPRGDSGQIVRWSMAVRRSHSEGNLTCEEITRLDKAGFVWKSCLSDSDLDYFGLVEGTKSYGWLSRSEEVFIRDMVAFKRFRTTYGVQTIPQDYVCPETGSRLYHRMRLYSGVEIASPSRASYIKRLGNLGIERAGMNLDRCEGIIEAYRAYTAETGSHSIPRDLVWGDHKLGYKISIWRTHFQRGTMLVEDSEFLISRGVQLECGYRYSEVSERFKERASSLKASREKGTQTDCFASGAEIKWVRDVQESLRVRSLRAGEVRVLLEHGLIVEHGNTYTWVDAVKELLPA